ncbi:MAG: hypothetical protein K2N69_01275, partial [Helicobacter sp.]|nr:hypothetical protein [Helicobacter sp.]
CVNVTPTARTLPLCAVVGTLRLKSNRESKITIFKAALCCGFAIALRALFLGILCSLIATLTLATTRRTSDMRDYFTNPAARTLLNAAA